MHLLAFMHAAGLEEKPSIYVENEDAIAGVVFADVGVYAFRSFFIEDTHDITPLYEKDFTSLGDAIDEIARFLRVEYSLDQPVTAS